MAKKKIFFISDVHLGDGSKTDSFRNKDELICRFFELVAAQGKLLIINGDFIDLIQCRNLKKITAAHPKVFEHLYSLAKKVNIIYVFGNHDSGIITEQDSFPFPIVDKIEPIAGVRIEHGHLLCNPNGKIHEHSLFWMRVHLYFEGLFNTEIRLPLNKHPGKINKTGHFLGHKLALLAVFFQPLLRGLRLTKWHSAISRWLNYWGRAETGDVNCLTEYADQAIASQRLKTLICGHSHVPGIIKLSGGLYVNTGSWSLRNNQFGVCDENYTNFKIIDFCSKQEYNDENYSFLHWYTFPINYLQWWKVRNNHPSSQNYYS